MNSLFRWAKNNSVILINAGSLIGTTAITSVLGFAYWWLAARLFSTDAVGFSSALISAMTLLGSFAVVGMGTLLIGELPKQQGKEFSLLSTALIVVGVLGCITGVVYAVIVSHVSSSFQFLGTSVSHILLFAVGVSLTAVTLVLDQALIGLLHGEMQLWRNGIFAGVKLAALFVVSLWISNITGLTIYATWVMGLICSLVVLVALVLSKRRRWAYITKPRWGWLKKLGGEAIRHHILNLTLEAPSMLLPMVITAMFSASVNAWFYVSWNLAGVANTAADAFATTLYAIGSKQPSALAHKLRMTLTMAVGVCAMTNLVLLIAPSQVLALFGHSYSEQASWCMRILSVESFPFIIKSHFITLSRIRGNITGTIFITTATGFLELGSSVVGARLGGLNGLSLGWLMAMTLEAIFMMPTVVRALRAAPEPAAEPEEEGTFSEEAIWLIDTVALTAINPTMIEAQKEKPHAQPPVEIRPLHSSHYNRQGFVRPRSTHLEPFTRKERAVHVSEERTIHIPEERALPHVSNE